MDRNDSDSFLLVLVCADDYGSPEGFICADGAPAVSCLLVVGLNVGKQGAEKKNT